MTQYKRWGDVNVIYQVYPRSFQDSDGDGVGDLKGIINRLDYFKGTNDSLGVDAIWLSPFFKSPMLDMGYDVSDYRAVDPLFGTLDDFKELIRRAHAIDLRVMIDFVPNHTSDQHAWFKASQESKDGEFSDYYVWRDAKPDGSEPNNWQSVFGGSVWQWHEGRKQYYLHSFLKEQPDLNWDNPVVRREMQDVLRFWLEFGVDGIRADAVRFMSKDAQLRDEDAQTNWQGGSEENLSGESGGVYSRYGENLFKYLGELTSVLHEFPDRIIIFEDYPDNRLSIKDQYLNFYNVDPEVGMPFNFDGMEFGFDATSFRDSVTRFQSYLNLELYRPVYCLSNHDQTRIATRFGGEDQARIIAMMLLTLPGMPVIYYGDEIGMTNAKIAHDEIRDASAFILGNDAKSRDPSRTPMRWQADLDNAGFSSSKPWLPVGDNVEMINVQSEMSEPDSVLILYRSLLKLRSKNKVLKNGDYETIEHIGHNVFAFFRRLDGKQIYVALNFAGSNQVIELPSNGKVLLATHPVDYPDISDTNQLTLRAFEGVIIELD